MIGTKVLTIELAFEDRVKRLKEPTISRWISVRSIKLAAITVAECSSWILQDPLDGLRAREDRFPIPRTFPRALAGIRRIRVPCKLLSQYQREGNSRNNLGRGREMSRSAMEDEGWGDSSRNPSRSLSRIRPSGHYFCFSSRRYNARPCASCCSKFC